MAAHQADEDVNPRYDALASLLREEDGIATARARYPQMNVNGPGSARHSNFSYFSTACFKGDLQVAQALLELGADATWNRFERSALIRACYNGEESGVKMVTWLLQCVTGIRASIDEENIWGDTALHIATFNRNTAIVRVLLRFGANWTKRNRAGETAEELTGMRGDVESAALIETFAQITEIGEWRPWSASEFPPDFRRALRCLVVISKSGTNTIE